MKNYAMALLSVFAVLTGVLLLFTVSCKKRDDFNEQGRIADLKHVEMWAMANISTAESNMFSNMVANWQDIHIVEQHDKIIYEVGLSNPGTVFIAGKETDRHNADAAIVRNNIRLLIFKDKGSGQIEYGAYMSIINNGIQQGLSKIHYKNVGNLDGQIFYYNLAGTFAIGYGYNNGVVVKKATPITKDDFNETATASIIFNEHTGIVRSISTQERLLAVAAPPPIDQDCTSERVTIYGLACVEAGRLQAIKQANNRLMWEAECTLYIKGYTYYSYCTDSGDGSYAPPAAGGGTDNPGETLSSYDIENAVPADDGKPGITNIQKYISCFGDGKTAQSYTITIYIDQPAPGTPAAYRIGGYVTGIDPAKESGKIYTTPSGTFFDVGHTFVGLEKNNTDGSSVKQFVGFYPSGFTVNSPGEFKDDSNHPYDVKYTMTVNAAQFNAALNSLPITAAKEYKLKTYNCTDGALDIVNAAGFNLPNVPTSVYRNNPGRFGEYLRANKPTANTTAGRATQGKGPCN